MTNYVIINGVNSNTINGLGINELPPITKPQMRAMQEEIDGRDGDITTNLGYSAYDKTITIGLFGTGYDINDIVAFFNGEGTIVFSNEADKYYNFKILNQIDYVALQKFKSASITFHCQPFKYPLTETPLEIEYSYIEDEGESLTLNNTGEATLKLDLLGNTSQTGTPTPSTPISVNTCSGDNEVVVKNKNLAFMKNGTYIYSNNTGVISNNNIMTLNTNGSTGSNSYFSFANGYTQQWAPTANIQGINDMNLTSNGGDYVATIITNKTMPSTINFYLWTSKDRNFQTRIDTYTTNTVTMSLNEDEHIKDIGIWAGSSNVFENYTIQVQLEKGRSATPYEPYQSQTYEVDLGTLELCKIGDYQDYFTKNSTGQWCKYNAIGKKVFDGSETWLENTPRFALELTGYASGTYQVYSNKFTYANTWQTHTATNNTTILYKDSAWQVARLSFNYNGVANVNEWKTWLSTNNVIAYYPLATPYLSLIEDNNLIEQLDNIQNAMSYQGTTNISQVSNDKPFIISVKAIEQGTNEVVVNNIGNVYSKPLIALEGSGNVDIYLDNTQILKANVEDKMNIDIAKLEAYNPDTSALLNRQVIGNYNTMTLQPGNNTIRIDGALDKATISNYTRWL